jgi:hypothetical protein
MNDPLSALQNASEYGITPEDCDAAADEIMRLRAMLAELERDALRYRALRDSKNSYPLFFIAQRDHSTNIVAQFAGEIADMNIDEMIAQACLNGRKK